MGRGTSRQAERIFVASTTSGTYNDKIILFMIWLFDMIREFLVHDYIPEFGAINHEDLLEFQGREEDKNMTNRRKITPINERSGILKLTRQIVDAIKPSQSGISHNIPIKIDGEGAITYELV